MIGGIYSEHFLKRQEVKILKVTVLVVSRSTHPWVDGIPNLLKRLNIGFLLAGKYVELKDTIDGFRGILEGKYDSLPEQVWPIALVTSLVHLFVTFCFLKATA